jgi:alcohol dehydrogenase class IV
MGERIWKVKQFYLPTKVITGLGCYSQLGEVVRASGQKALLTCGHSALRRSGVLQRGLDGLRQAGVDTTLYDAVGGEPTLEMVQEAIELARQEQVEVVIGVGGGSAMDVGKAAAVVCPQPGTVREYHSGRPIEQPGLPFISVPTTAGTGTEVTNNAVLTDLQLGVKKSIRGPLLYPKTAVVDPELTLSLPPRITASSGADALCQAIESFVGHGAQPPTEALAGQAIHWIGRSLVRAYEDGSDIQARTDMLYGSLLTGMSMTNTRLGGAHGLAHPLGYRYHISHGVICGLLLPYVMEHSLEYALGKYAQVARLLGADTAEMSAQEAAQQAVAMVRRMIGKIGIPDHLRAFGVKVEDFPALIEQALPSGNLKNNPKPLGADDLQAILQRVL